MYILKVENNILGVNPALWKTASWRGEGLYEP